MPDVRFELLDDALSGSADDRLDIAKRHDEIALLEHVLRLEPMELERLRGLEELRHAGASLGAREPRDPGGLVRVVPSTSSDIFSRIAGTSPRPKAS